MIGYHSANNGARNVVTSPDTVEIPPVLDWDDVAGGYRWADKPSKGQEKKTFKPLKGSGIVSLSDYEISQLPNAARKCVNAKYALEVIQNGKVSYVRAFCKTWKCPICASYVRAVNYCQVRDTLKQYELSSIFYAVNTVSSTVLTNVLDINADESYEYVYKCWKRMYQRIRRHYSDIKMIQTVERQGNKYAHLNNIFVSKQLSEDWIASPLTVSSWYNKISQEAGFGHMTSFAPVDNVEGMASYITKISNKGDDGSTVNQSSHITKLTQLPLNAPKGFRRLRSSKGFLVRRLKGMSKDSGVEYKFIRGHAELLSVMQQSAARHDEKFSVLPPDAGSDKESRDTDTNVSEPVSISPTSTTHQGHAAVQSLLPFFITTSTSQSPAHQDSGWRIEQEAEIKEVSSWELVRMWDTVSFGTPCDDKVLDERASGVVVSMADYRKNHIKNG
jgi:hypothetical protein